MQVNICSCRRKKKVKLINDRPSIANEENERKQKYVWETVQLKPFMMMFADKNMLQDVLNQVILQIQNFISNYIAACF